VRFQTKETIVTRDELLRSKRFPKWLVGLMLVGAAFSGVACEANVDADGETGVEDEESSEDEEDVDSDVDVDTDVQEDAEDDE
jgi:hypothetical protein